MHQALRCPYNGAAVIQSLRRIWGLNLRKWYQGLGIWNWELADKKQAFFFKTKSTYDRRPWSVDLFIHQSDSYQTLFLINPQILPFGQNGSEW
jgi:hypothetical protein